MAYDQSASRLPAEGIEELRAHLAAIVDSSDDAIVSKSREGIVTSWNQGAERLYGYSAAEAIGRHISFLVPPERLDEQRQLTEKILQGERVKNLDTIRLPKNGGEIPVSLTLSPIYCETGTITGISIIARDNTERLRMVRLLRESEMRYRVLVEMAPDAVFVHQDGRFVYANCAALGICGVRSREELQRRTLFDLVHPEDRGKLRQRIDELKADQGIAQQEYRMCCPQGKELVLETSSSLIDYQGIPSIQVIARDVTLRKQQEREREQMLKDLAFQQSRFEIMVRQLPIGVVIAEAPSGKTLYQNERSRQIFGRDIAPVSGIEDYRQWEMFRLDGAPLPAEQCPVALSLLQGEIISGDEYKIRRGDGSYGYICVNSTPLRDASGEIVSAVAAFTDITESKLAAQALFESEERLKLALDAAEMGSCDIDVNTGAGIWSLYHFTLLGYPAPEGESAPAATSMWLDLVHRDDLEEVKRLLEQARRDDTLFRSEHRILRAGSGETVWVNVMGRFICEQTEGRCRFIGVIFDVSERKAAEEALLRNVRRFRRMADTMPQIFWTARPDGSVDYINAYFEEYAGIDRSGVEEGHVTAETLLSGVVHPDDRDGLESAWFRSMESCEPFQYESRVRRKDGVYRWHLSRARAELDEQGRAVKWYGTATDIDELRETQEKLAASETRFRWLYESNLIAIFYWNRDGAITDANQAYCDLAGYTAEECRSGGLNWLDVTAPEYLEKDVAAVAESQIHGICRSYEKLFINHATGVKVPVLTAIAISAGSDEGIGFAVDLTELKRAEHALKHSESTLKLAVETTGLGIFDLELKTGKGEWSPIAKSHYGLPADAEVDLSTVITGVHPEDKEKVERIARDAASPGGAGIYSAEYRTVGAMDGKVRWLSMRGRVFYDDEGTPLRLVGACLNVTDVVQAQETLNEEMSERLRAVEELRRQEQLLIRQGRLAAMGEMIANIAHQWRQPLNTLGLIIQELPTYHERNLLTVEYLEGSVSRAMQVINYMSQTIDGFRNFFGPDKEYQTFLASEVLEKTVSILDAAFAELNLELVVWVDREAVVHGIPNEYSQVLLNILMNAKDALLERKVEHPKVEVRLFREGGKSVVTITDNAGGIPTEIMDKIFDPYFTTKGPDKGTGIGLFMSKTIIEKNMKGSLTVTNQPEGAQFRIEV
ncbi:sensor histidine kinase, PAS, PAS, PAS, PAS, PAS, PAS and PAS domain-containing [Citrifermentans bemidjiense Bem]|uniref:histidine kinase n=1 Tax=Citrifermentans bemidjiense (strain ATCC BAA-1014 / DSM 16622 / JCM 12645 / Bem) TaxID=404380 RepID=B5EDD8_CITBB|nr:PAS domain S-box protein [Citrifermentans bemidjiense]ACH39134.1 sensor histidine kinase, PAS, PAS, PAS, PAS, PAS, PAS and PAS domain-containing [Citrifermentans bemidjiense Bem]